MSYLTTLETTTPTGNLTRVMKNERDWMTAHRHVSQHREHPQQLSKTKNWSNPILWPHIRHLRTRTAASRELSSRGSSGRWQRASFKMDGQRRGSPLSSGLLLTPPGSSKTAEEVAQNAYCSALQGLDPSEEGLNNGGPGCAVRVTQGLTK